MTNNLKILKINYVIDTDLLSLALFLVKLIKYKLYI